MDAAELYDFVVNHMESKGIQREVLALRVIRIDLPSWQRFLGRKPARVIHVWFCTSLPGSPSLASGPPDLVLGLPYGEKAT
jgi:hypothetical protein